MDLLIISYTVVAFLNYFPRNHILAFQITTDNRKIPHILEGISKIFCAKQVVRGTTSPNHFCMLFLSVPQGYFFKKR